MPLLMLKKTCQLQEVAIEIIFMVNYNTSDYTVKRQREKGKLYAGKNEWTKNLASGNIMSGNTT